MKKMSDSLNVLDLSYLPNDINNIDNCSKIIHDSIDFSNISIISKSKFAQRYHFLCKVCERIPIIKFINDNKIRYICECEKNPIKYLNIKEIFNFLYQFDEIDLGCEKLKCYLHSKVYGYYCEKCKKNLCPECYKDCKEHRNRIKSLFFKNNSIDKYNYIYEKIKDKNQNYIELENDVFDKKEQKNEYISIKNDVNSSNFYENEDSYYSTNNDDKYVINTNEKSEIINTIENNNNDENFNDEYFYINFFTIFLNDYINFPNIKHIESISNIEIYMILLFHDYNEIILNYRFMENNIKQNIIELFGGNFVNNNKENCFLIINDKIISLSRFINLKDFFAIIPPILNFSLDVRLIERKYKLMTDLSFMFDGIITITSKSNFSSFENKNIRKMDHMFNNCNSLKDLPDSISKIITDNVTDMSYMFYNCTSLEQLPDISKWNIEKVNDISGMFGNCESLESIPDISNWNTNNIKKMNKTFLNCKSLLSLPNLHNWNIQGDVEDNDIFKGCQSLEENIQENNFKCNQIFGFLKNASCTCFWIGCGILLLCLLFCILYGIYFFFWCKFSSFFYSFKLKSINEIISDPIISFAKNINITYISQYSNNADETIIMEFNKIKNSFIDNLINLTKFNNNIIIFESTKSKFKITNIIRGVVSLFKFITLFLMLFKNKIKCIKFDKIPFLILFIILNIFSIIFEILDIIYI